VSFLIGIVIYAIKEKITQAGVFEFFEYFASGVAAGALSTLAIKLFPFMDLYRIIIASIIILLPGLAITNAMKDALYGDIVSSMFRLTEAVFCCRCGGSRGGNSTVCGFALDLIEGDGVLWWKFFWRF